jgi:hypothetical protein
MDIYRSISRLVLSFLKQPKAGASTHHRIPSQTNLSNDIELRELKNSSPDSPSSSSPSPRRNKDGLPSGPFASSNVPDELIFNGADSGCTSKTGDLSISYTQTSPEFSKTRETPSSHFKVFLKDGCIGCGTYGVVYKAVLIGTSKIVAAKILRAFLDHKVGYQLTGTSFAQIDFVSITVTQDVEREICNWSSLDHPNIHRFLGYCLNYSDHRDVILFSEYCEMGNLCNYMNEKDPPMDDLEQVRMVSLECHPLSLSQHDEY